MLRRQRSIRTNTRSQLVDFFFIFRDNNAESVVQRLKSNSMTRVVVVFAERAQVGATIESRRREPILNHGKIKGHEAEKDKFLFCYIRQGSFCRQPKNLKQ